MILILLQIEIQHLLMRSMERTVMDPKGRTEPGYRMHAFIVDTQGQKALLEDVARTKIRLI